MTKRSFPTGDTAIGDELRTLTRTAHRTARRQLHRLAMGGAATTLLVGLSISPALAAGGADNHDGFNAPANACVTDQGRIFKIDTIELKNAATYLKIDVIELKNQVSGVKLQTDSFIKLDVQKVREAAQTTGCDRPAAPVETSDSLGDH